MKNVFNKFLVVIVFLFFSVGLNAQKTNKSTKIKTEKVEGGIKVTTTKNGKTTATVYSYKDAIDYFEKHADNLDIDIQQNEGNNYQITYATNKGKTETIDINLGDLTKELGSYFDELEINVSELIEKVKSSVEIEEEVDENGNKTYKIKSSK